ncbi:MAG: putative permease [Ilumatobacteraceae bacterium]|nr:putative permease [Ilumatobacteraceae bacterium]
MLVLAGIGAGLTGSIAGLASVISYPALLAFGLPPVTANVSNSVALLFSTGGSIAGSRPDLVGQGNRVRQLAVAGVLGGAAGAVLLLATPAGSFELAVPVLIAIASVAILARRQLVDEAAAVPHRFGPGVVGGVFVVGIYGGYFGAGAGVMLLALILFATGEPLPRCNALKNVVAGLANGVAAVGFAFFGPVRWAVVLPLGIGLFIGGRTGPLVVRRAPAGPLRMIIAIAGFGVAIKLAVTTYW